MLMSRFVFICTVMVCASCATFDRTHIPPGQTVPGPGFSFEVPTHNNWTAVEYGRGNKIHLFQLNNQDSYAIIVTLNRGPYFGMYQHASAHLAALRLKKEKAVVPEGLEIDERNEWLEPKYGELCVRYTSKAKDWRGRRRKGPALVHTIGLSCAHPTLNNVILNTEIIRRHEVDAEKADLSRYADELFASFDYD